MRYLDAILVTRQRRVEQRQRWLETLYTPFEVAEGTGEELLGNPEVKKAYLGG